MSVAYALTYGVEPGATCAKCAQTAKANARHVQRPALYVLAQGSQRWSLCGNHAAAAAHNLQIPTKTFTPHLQVQNTEGIA